MSIKINGGVPFKPPVDQTRKSKKPEGAKSFQDSLKDTSKAAPKDSVTLSGNVPKTSYDPRFQPQGNASQADPVVQQVLNSPEEVRSRVQEIKDLIQSGGAQAYFDSIDSENVADRLLNSGVLDDTI